MGEQQTGFNSATYITESILLDLFVDNHLYDNDSYASDTDLKNGKKPETGLKKIEFDINVNDNEIDDLNNKAKVHIKDSLADDNSTNIEYSGVQHKQDDQHNHFLLLLKTNYNRTIS